MARYKPQDCTSLLLPVVLSEQNIPGTRAAAPNHLFNEALKFVLLDAQD